MKDIYRGLFESLVKENEEYLVQYIIRCVGCSTETAMDITQDVFLRAWINIEKLSSHPNPVGWLFIAAKYIAWREMERRYHSFEVSSHIIADIGLCNMELPIRLLLPNGLKPQEINIIILRLEENLSYKQISERLGMKEAACRKLYYRAILHCRELMGIDMDE